MAMRYGHLSYLGLSHIAQAGRVKGCLVVHQNRE
jgi:hypothetical protein